MTCSWWTLLVLEPTTHINTIKFAYLISQASYSPQINPIYVIIGFTLLMSWLQWVMRNQMYESAFNQIVSSRNFKIRVNEECEKDGRKGDKFYKEEVADRLK